jgi:hypothetical protein
MTQFAFGRTVYADAVLVEKHLDCLGDVGFITYYQDDSPIPESISKSLLDEYRKHLNGLVEDDVHLSSHEICTPYSNYFMIYRSDKKSFEQSFAAGKKALRDKSNQDADEFDIRREW